MKTSRILQKLHILHPPKQADIDWARFLSVEMLEKIFGYILEERETHTTRVAYTRDTLQPTLRAAALVCRVWYDVVTEHLYNEIYLSSTRAFEILGDALSKHKRLRPLVHQFYFTSKVYASGHVQPVSTAMDIYNYGRMFDLCPNMNELVRAKPWTKLLPPNDELAFRAIKFNQSHVDRLTFLEISLPNAALFGGRLGFSSSVEFPALQQLFITASWRTYHGRCELDTPQWFRMPQLRRLCLSEIRVRSWQKLVFPEHSPLINTIELLKGDYEMVNNLFDPETSPLLPHAKTLESLTITAKQLGEVKYARSFDVDVILDPCRQGLTVWSLWFLESLTELCLPFRSFAKTRISSFPPHLKDLALSGYLWDFFKEEVYIIASGFVNLEKVLQDKLVGNGPQKLKRVQVFVRDFEILNFREKLDAASTATGVKLELGINNEYKLKNLRSDLIDIGMKKVSLR